jgi:hypothetical protein
MTRTSPSNEVKRAPAVALSAAFEPANGLPYFET